LRDQAGPEFEATVADAFMRYRESLPDERRVLLDRFQRKDLAMKVVVGISKKAECNERWKWRWHEP